MAFAFLALVALAVTVFLFVFAFWNSLYELLFEQAKPMLVEFAKTHSTMLAAIGGAVVGAVLYWLLMAGVIRRCSVLVLPGVLERWMDIIAGHTRFKVVRSFASYCNSCRQMVCRAARRWGSGEGQKMYTVQTPIQPKDLGTKEAKAYQLYMGTTIRVLLTEGWVYARLVYLPCESDAFGNSFARSFEFCRSFLYEYFFGYKQEPAQNTHLVPPLAKYYPYGMAWKAHRDLGGPLQPGAVKVGYTAHMEGLLDTVSRLDLHLPPSREFSIAFTGPGGNGDFFGCLRVREPGNLLGDLARKVLRSPLPQVKEKLTDLFRREWNRIETVDKSWVQCMDLIKAFRNPPHGIVPFFERNQPDEIAKNWRRGECDRLIFLDLVIVAARAVWAVRDKVPRATTWQDLVVAAERSVETRWADLIPEDGRPSLLNIAEYQYDGRRGVEAVVARIAKEVGDLPAS